MRLFTAIELTDEARVAIDAEQKAIVSRLCGQPRSIRLVRAEHLHLSLVFIGEVPDGRAAKLVEAMSADIGQAPFRLVFGGLGVFPANGAPRVLWLGVVDGAREAVDLHAHVAARLTGAGVAVDKRPFHPHLTLGRWRDGPRSARVGVTPDVRQGPLSATPGVVAAVDVSAVALIQSRLSPAGPSYTRLAQARLVWP